MSTNASLLILQWCPWKMKRKSPLRGLNTFNAMYKVEYFEYKKELIINYRKIDAVAFLCSRANTCIFIMFIRNICLIIVTFKLFKTIYSKRCILLTHTPYPQD